MNTNEHNQIRKEILEGFVDVFDVKLFKTLGEPVRIKILQYLLLNGRSDIGSIAEQLPQDRSVISRHLNHMYEAGILYCEKETRHMYYEINGQAFVDKVENFLNQIKKCVSACDSTNSCLK
jgi:DNA-binding transcriptional ArsR family regulator